MNSKEIEDLRKKISDKMNIIHSLKRKKEILEQSETKALKLELEIGNVTITNNFIKDKPIQEYIKNQILMLLSKEIKTEESALKKLLKEFD